MKYFGCGFEVGFLRFPDCTPPGRAGSRSPPRARVSRLHLPAVLPPVCLPPAAQRGLRGSHFTK